MSGQNIHAPKLVAFAACNTGSADRVHCQVYSHQRGSVEVEISRNMSTNGEQDIRNRYESVCAELNMDEQTAEKAWASYHTINNDYVLEVR